MFLHTCQFKGQSMTDQNQALTLLETMHHPHANQAALSPTVAARPFITRIIGSGP